MQKQDLTEADPIATDVTRWSVGVTTSPGSSLRIDNCLDSIIKAGWASPRVFAGAEVQLRSDHLQLPRTMQAPCPGILANYVLALTELLMREPHADAFLLLQADYVLYEEAKLREYFEACLWPGENTGIVSLCGPTVDADTAAGWCVVERSSNWSIAALIFSREGAKRFISDRQILERAGDKNSQGTTAALTEWAGQQGLKLFVSIPPLACRGGRPWSRAHAKTIDGEIQAVATRSREAAAHTSPVSVVIPVRDRAGARVKNCLESLRWQRPRTPHEIFVVSYGSRPEIDLELAALCGEVGARLVCTGRPNEVWNRSLALNIGIRATSRDSRFVMVLDADMILAPNLFEVLLDGLGHDPNSLILCQSSDLSESVPISSDPRELRAAFSQLWSQSQLRGTHGCGGIQVASREFFFDVRGFDEDFKFWGGEDSDMVNRAERYGLKVRWITAETAMLHQYHVREISTIQDAGKKLEAERSVASNRRLLKQRETQISRNPDGWAGLNS